MDFSNMESIAMKVHKDTLRNLRKKMGFSQEALANESRVSKKTIARIESGEVKGEPRGDTVKLIAKALRVKPEVLAEKPESETVQEQELRKIGLRVIKLPIDGETLISYDLVEKNYGVGMRGLVYAAPMLFTLLAEMSLNERRRRLNKMKKKWEGYEQNVPEHMIPNHVRHEDSANAEENSINKRDIFARRIHSGDDNFGMNSISDESYFDASRSPFNDFLIEQAEKLGSDNDAVNPEKIHFYPYGGSLEIEGELEISYEAPLFEDFRERITGGSTRADYALSRGYTRLRDIPHRLQPPSPYVDKGEENEDVVSERVKWLEEKVPDEEWEKWERWIDGLNFNIELPSEGDTENA